MINENLIYSLTDEDIGEEYHELTNPEIRYSSRGIVIRDDGKIAIFNKQKKNEFKLPGGGIENGETKEEAFIREVFEETGCKIEIIGNLGITLEYKSQTNFKQISYVFVGKIIEESSTLHLTEKEADEGARLIFETPEKALSLITNCYDNIVGSKYDSLYKTKYMVLRDRKILEYYLNHTY